MHRLTAVLVTTFFVFAKSFSLKAQTPTAFLTQNNPTSTYVYVGSITKSTSDASNLQKLKVEVFGGDWGSGTIGQTTFYIANRGGLAINKTTFGGAPIDGNWSFQAYQNGAQTDFYLVSSPGGYAVITLLSTWLRDGIATFVTPTSSSCTPSGSLISPLNVNTLMTTDVNGNMAVNAPAASPQYRFAVDGAFVATSATVKLYNNWPDYVFQPSHKLPSLAEVQTFIKRNHHLPEMPSAEEVNKNGLNLGESNRLLTQKVEELTYI